MKKFAAALLIAVLCARPAGAEEEIRFFGKSVMFSTNTIVGNLSGIARAHNADEGAALGRP